MRNITILLLLLASSALAGCVRRTLIVETDPPGAEVWIDGDPVGLTPVRIPFSHYGTREIVVAKGGFALIHERRPMKAPWYQRFPLDFFTENAWPGTFVDERYFVYALQPEQADPDGVLARAKVLREEALKQTKP